VGGGTFDPLLFFLPLGGWWGLACPFDRGVIRSAPRIAPPRNNDYFESAPLLPPLVRKCKTIIYSGWIGRFDTNLNIIYITTSFIFIILIFIITRFVVIIVVLIVGGTCRSREGRRLYVVIVVFIIIIVIIIYAPLFFWFLC
jgi:hypothetical protein